MKQVKIGESAKTYATEENAVKAISKVLHPDDQFMMVPVVVTRDDPFLEIVRFAPVVLFNSNGGSNPGSYAHAGFMVV